MCVSAVVYCRTKRRDDKKKTAFIVKVYARIFLFLWFHSTGTDTHTNTNNGFLVSFAVVTAAAAAAAAPTAAMSMCHLTHTHTHSAHSAWMSLVCNPCSIYCMLSFPFHADTSFFFCVCVCVSFFQSTFSHSILLHTHKMRWKREHVACNSSCLIYIHLQ